MNGLIIDNFAGGGGASAGILRALGRSPDIAVNHDPEAIAMHKMNHPDTSHLCGDVWDVDPVGVCGGKPVDLAWFSPDCKHHSKAKGGKPRDAKIRALAWVVIRWARTVQPRIIILENVEEFQDWGPLLSNNMPDPKQVGSTFRMWLGKLKAAGYEVEMRELRACDYGAPTTRKRLFVIARCDGRPIVWPEPTYGPGRSQPYRTAAECIDWSIPCPSIFERKRPLAAKTLRRIARGIQKYVIDSPSPFIVPTAHAGDYRVHSLHEPLRTVTASRRGDHAIVTPFVQAVKTWGGGGNEPRSLLDPMRTVTASKRGEFAIVAPTLVQTGYGERPGQAPRCLDLHKPLGTVVADQKHGLVAALLTKHNGGHEATGSRLDGPIHTVTARDSHALTAAFITKYYGTSTGSRADDPMPTVTANGRGGGHLAEVRAFLRKYSEGRRELGIVTVDDELYAIVDIGMRMLQPRELFRAQGFDDSYIINPTCPNKRGKMEALTKTAQIRCCGNAVPPNFADALVRANVLDAEERVA